jgi:hypothetical protein
MCVPRLSVSRTAFEQVTSTNAIRIRYCLNKLEWSLIFPVEFKMNFVCRRNIRLGNYGNGSGVKGHVTKITALVPVYFLCL